MNRTTFVVLILLLFSSSFSFSQVKQIGINPLNLNSGARPTSLSDAYTAVSDDMSSGFYNPASLVNNKGLIFSYMDAGNFSIAQAATTPGGTFGFGIIYKKYEEISFEGTTADYDNSVIFIGYGFKLGGAPFIEDCSLGLNLKHLLSQQISIGEGSSQSSQGNSNIGFGLLYDPEKSWYKFGLNFGGNVLYKLGSTKEAVEADNRFGMALNILGDKEKSILNSKDFGLLLSVDTSLNKKLEGRESSSVGIELSLSKMYFLRLGSKQVVKSDENESFSSSGIGIKLSQDIRIDLSSYKDPLTEEQVSFLSILYMPPMFSWQPEAEKEKIPKTFLKVVYPDDNFTTYDDRINIRGDTIKGAELYINDMTAFVKADQSFNTEIPLNPGKNLVEIKAKFKGYENHVQRRVLRKAKVVIAEEVEVEKRINVDIKNKEQQLTAKAKRIQDQIKKSKTSAEKEKWEKEAKRIDREMDKLALEKKKLEEKKETLEERKEKVENLVTLGVIEVSPTEKFEIEAKITKGEMISWLIKAANIPLPDITENICEDVPMDHKYAQEIKAALDRGFIKTDENNRFYPDRSVSEPEGEKIFREFGVIK